MNVKKMSDKTADVLFANTDTAGGLGELQGLVRRIIAALDAAPMWESMAFIGKEIGDDSSLIYDPAVEALEFTMPCPVWPEFDYTVPTC